ncbi:MAG: flagellar biosynthesis anti-sigma factor FlgM [Gammaproteobacteria bacterium]|jgi:flagellar biosynthesis anti-sigma factor FlgM
MSNEINTGKIPLNLATGKSQGAQQPESPKPGAAKTAAIAATSSPSADKVSMTGDASRLQQLEGLLKDTPQVNNTLVTEVSQLIASGKLEINLERIAANLLETEAGITDPER